MQDWGERCHRWAGIRTEWLEVAGTPTRLLRADGPAGTVAGSAAPIVLVHGLGGSSTNWLDVIGPLSARGPVVAMDLPGFGETEPGGDNTPTVLRNARFVTRLTDRLGWDRIVLMGNSMGGMISTLVAVRRPGLVESLVLVAPALPARVRDAHRVPLGAAMTFAPFMVPGVGEQLMRWRADRSSAEELFERTILLVLSDPSRMSPELLALGLEGARRASDLPWRGPSFTRAARSVLSLLTGTRRRVLTTALDRLQSPTLLVWGDEDRLIGRPVVDATLERRPDMDLVLLEGVGHVPMMEVPDQFLAEVTAWLDQVGQRVAAY